MTTRIGRRGRERAGLAGLGEQGGLVRSTAESSRFGKSAGVWEREAMRKIRMEYSRIVMSRLQRDNSRPCTRSNLRRAKRTHITLECTAKTAEKPARPAARPRLPPTQPDTHCNRQNRTSREYAQRRATQAGTSYPCRTRTARRRYVASVRGRRTVHELPCRALQVSTLD